MSTEPTPALATNAAPSQLPATEQSLQLEDIHLPEQPAFWPPAPGWWLLAAIVAGAIPVLVIKLRKRRTRRRQQRKIQLAVDQLKQQLDAGNPQAAITEINLLLRKLALMHFSREETASLSGKQWLEFLDRSSETNNFTKGPGKLLGDGAYVTHLPQKMDTGALLKVVEQWIKKVTRNSDRQPLHPLYPEVFNHVD